jgi:hypothetical protein
MKPESRETEKDFGKDLKMFAQLPANTGEVKPFKERAVKSTGQESTDLNKMIRDKSKLGPRRLKPSSQTRGQPNAGCGLERKEESKRT